MRRILISKQLTHFLNQGWTCYSLSFDKQGSILYESANRSLKQNCDNKFVVQYVETLKL